MELLREKPGRETRLLAIWQIRMREMAVHTKELIIQALLELLNERPLFRITVKDIVERCKVNRNTFYYHFRDIPDVVEYVWRWIPCWKVLVSLWTFLEKTRKPC